MNQTGHAPPVEHRFVKGDPRHPSRAGTNNYKKLVRFMGSVIEDKDYQEVFRARAIAGKLAPAVEAAMWAYYAGKPKDSMDRALGTDPGVDLATMPSADLAARREVFTARLIERQRLREQSAAKKEADSQRDALGISHAESETRTA